MTDPDLRARAREAGWYHSMELVPGLVTEGEIDMRPHVDRFGLPRDMRGMRALDVGPFDGFWAFEMERRGAEVAVLDVDHVLLDWPAARVPADHVPRGDTFDLAHALRQSSVARLPDSVYELAAERVGTFDVVLCGSALMHLRDPVRALERISGVCRERLVVCEEYSPRLELLPFLRAAEFRGSLPWMTWWRPGSATWIEMIRCAGFDAVERRARFAVRLRGKRSWVPLVIIHARAATGSAARGAAPPS